MKVSSEELGDEIRKVIPKLIEREIERELADIQTRIAERVRAAIGRVKTQIVNDRATFGMPEITISVTIGGEAELTAQTALATSSDCSER